MGMFRQLQVAPTKALGLSRHLCCRVKVVEFDEQIPDSLLPLLVFSLFRPRDAAKRSFFHGINLLLRELDQFAAEMFLIVRFHDMASGRSRTVQMTGCLQRLALVTVGLPEKRPEKSRRAR